MTKHEHESWQIRTDPDGKPYCAACGQKVEPEVHKTWCATNRWGGRGSDPCNCRDT